MDSLRKKRVQLFIILISIVLGILAIILLYTFNWIHIVDSYITQEGSLGVVIIISLRIVFVSSMGLYTLYQWFKQEERFMSDMPFLFALFFILLVFGKALDLFVDFIFFQHDLELVLIVLKARYLIMIFDFLPMIYLSSEMILFSLSLRNRFKRLSDKKYQNKVRKRVLVALLLIEAITGILAPTVRILSMFYPIIVIPSLITIVWLFRFAYKNKRLSQVNTFILTVGFGMYLISQIIRPLIQFIIGESPLFLIIAESTDLLIFIIIFIGFSKKANYATSAI
jgi:hypothetical protein